MVEEKMLILLRQGRLSKWFSGIGQEAIAVGVAAALRPDDPILPLHRISGSSPAADSTWAPSSASCWGATAATPAAAIGRFISALPSTT